MAPACSNLPSRQYAATEIQSKATSTSGSMMRRMSSETRYGTLCGGRLPILIRMPDTGMPTKTTTHRVVTNFQPSWISVLHSMRRKTGARCCLRAEWLYRGQRQPHTSSASVGQEYGSAPFFQGSSFVSSKLRAGALMQARLP
eukprot:scaffold29629_cov59-Phaeocystis_antarctica.AAC.2